MYNLINRCSQNFDCKNIGYFRIIPFKIYIYVIQYIRYMFVLQISFLKGTGEELVSHLIY